MSHGKTRFISCILLIAILFSVNISANTMATINGKEYSKASSAINEAKSGDTVKFTSEELNGSLTVENKNIVLDGITIKNSDDSALYIKNSVVTIKNGSVSAMGTGSAIILEIAKKRHLRDFIGKFLCENIRRFENNHGRRGDLSLGRQRLLRHRYLRQHGLR